uniref:ATP synthase F0 subunit 8 n=1 Tax=Cimbex luteus TaxID=1384799 RepID=A0A7T1FUV8_9HYME|nr:ATP synthase F0 subunit 8 [Cimbex luteus]QPM99415.2 ATP synthase F0 subunit 8 [Cimbex luteus]UXW64280.1 ATP synthase F0 subunit 8 [Cimbex luteus]
MPQMYPLNWLSHYCYFISLVFLSMLLHYFNYNINTKYFIKNNNNNILMNKKTKTLKWKW